MTGQQSLFGQPTEPSANAASLYHSLCPSFLAQAESSGEQEQEYARSLRRLGAALLAASCDIYNHQLLTAAAAERPTGQLRESAVLDKATSSTSSKPASGVNHC